MAFIKNGVIFEDERCETIINFENLDDITIPNTVKNSKTKWHISDENKKYFNYYKGGYYLKTVDNEYFLLFDVERDEKYRCTPDFEINDNCVVIGSPMGTGFTRDIIIPDSVEYIGEYAFYECSFIDDEGKVANRRVIIGSSVKEIGYKAFGYLSGVESLNIPKNVEFIAEEAFIGCRNLKELTINCKYISARAFDECCRLEKLIVLENVKTIEDNCWFEALEVYNLSSVSNEIASSSGRCSHLYPLFVYNDIKEPSKLIRDDDFIFADIKGERYLVKYTMTKEKEEITLPNKFEYKICDYVFNHNYLFSLKKIIIYDNVKGLGKEVFGPFNFKKRCNHSKVYTNNKIVIDYCVERYLNYSELE